jgi:hypothetical protein
MRTLIVPALLLGAVLAALAQVDTEFTAWMKSANTAWENLRKADGPAGVEAVRSAERLGGIYENMIEFWRQRNAVKAVEWSEQGKAAAVQLASAANSGDAAKAAAAQKVLDGTCRSCHEAYREKLPGGGYRILDQSSARVKTSKGPR